MTSTGTRSQRDGATRLPAPSCVNSWTVGSRSPRSPLHHTSRSSDARVAEPSPTQGNHQLTPIDELSIEDRLGEAAGGGAIGSVSSSARIHAYSQSTQRVGAR